MIAAVGAAAAGGCAMGPGVAVPFEVRQARVTQQDIQALDNAVALAAKLEYRQAGLQLQRLADRFEAAGDGRHAAEATFWLAYCDERQGRPYEAAALYKRLLERYPQSAPAPEARRRLDRLIARGIPAAP